MDYYEKNWDLYQKHTEKYNEDIEYYFNFCKGFRTLELFAGYGRVTNQLVKNNIDIDIVELNKDFAKFINLSDSKKNICNVLNFIPQAKYERIIAAYNSFCLISHDKDINVFFNNLNKWLDNDGEISLNYYNMQNVGDSIFEKEIFIKENKYIVKSYIKKINDKQSIWVDEYIGKDYKNKCEYPVRIYTEKDIINLAKNHGMILDNIVENHNIVDTKISGWKNYILRKNF